MNTPQTCRICGINDAFNPMCYDCHILYWEFEKTLTSEQTNELQMNLLKDTTLPFWFYPWWRKMKNLKAFL